MKGVWSGSLQEKTSVRFPDEIRKKITMQNNQGLKSVHHEDLGEVGRR